MENQEISYIKKYIEEDKWDDAVKRFKKGEPIQYIIGNVNFYGYILSVNKHVLIPRFETEELIEKTIFYIKKYFSEQISIVDIGTGSGAIAIALKKEIPKSHIDAVDISHEALEVAKKNALDNEAQITFYEGNLLEPLTKTYDILISNPPYIDKEEEIMEIVKNNEPHIALYADHQGLFYYEEILKNASQVLNSKNMIAFEIGYMQGKKIKNIANQYFPNAIISIEKDMSGRNRFVFILNL